MPSVKNATVEVNASQYDSIKTVSEFTVTTESKPIQLCTCIKITS